MSEGQYLTFRRSFGGEELRRSCSICAPRGEGTLRVGIKRVDNAVLSGPRPVDNAVIGGSTIVAAMAFVKAGAVIPPRSLVTGIPGKVSRELSDAEIRWKREGTRVYQALMLRSQQSLREVEPLECVEENRPRFTADAFEPLMDAHMVSMNDRRTQASARPEGRRIGVTMQFCHA